VSAATVAAYRARVAARRERAEARVRDAFAAYVEPADVPAPVWDSAVAWAAHGAVCFGDMAADVRDVCPDGWDTDAIDAALARAVDDYNDNDNGRV
jgi:hypothetical protein